MNHHAVANLALIFAAQARIEGMKAENAQRASRGESLAYDEGSFFTEAHNLELLARDTNEWGWQSDH